MEQIPFGPFSVDLAATRLLRDGVDIKLRPQAFHVLKTLVLNGGQYVDYEHMIREAWEGTLVSRHTVDVTIGEIRRALSEYRSWITCRPKLGYRLEVPQSEDRVREGWHYWRRRTREGFEKALACFQTAAQSDGTNFRAFEGISLSYLMLATYGMRAPLDMYKGFLKAHRRAVRLCGMSPELRSSRAHGLHMFERKLARAEAEFQQALKEKPELSTGYICLAMLYATMGRLDESIELLGREREIDPLWPVLPATEVFVRFCRREYDLAVESGRRALELHPYLQLGRAFYAQALEYSGRVNEALEQYRLAWVLSTDLPWLRALEAACLAKHGKRREALSILEEIEQLRKSEYVDAYFVALLREALGQRDEAFAELRRALKENSANLYAVEVDPKADSLRGDPRFATFRRKLFDGVRKTRRRPAP